jgi:O-antigen/teichoic acid export membrane protein
MTSDKTEKSLSRQSVEGAALLVATRFCARFIGFISVSITARILTPDDFGLVGAASLVIGLFAVLNQIGLSEYIIRTKDIEKKQLHTIWTIRLLISSSIAMGIFAAAPLAAEVLQDPRLVEVLRVLCAVSVLSALQSPATQFFARNLDFGKDLVLKSLDKIVAVMVTIAGAYYFQTFWALVWGQLAGAAFSVLSSHIAMPFRPMLSLGGGQAMARFAVRTFVMGILNYGVHSIDEWIAKRSSTTAEFGGYHVARDLCRLLVSELISPAGHVFFPGAAKVQENPAHLNEIVGRFAGAAFVASFAVSTGVAAVASEVIYMFLGYQWGAAIAFVPYIAFGTGAIILVDLFAGLYVIKDAQNRSSSFRFMRLSLLIIGCGVMGAQWGLIGIARAYAAAAIVSALIELLWLFSKSMYQVSLLKITWRPFVAAVAMFGLVGLISVPVSWPLVIVAVCKVAAGAVTYVSVLVLLWWISGRPNGGETEIIQRLRDVFPIFRK